eukprot:3165081-Pyramimonas_sp.AAC.2
MMILRSREDYKRPFRVAEYSVLSQNRERVITTKGGERMVPLTFNNGGNDGGAEGYSEEEEVTNQAMLKVYVKERASDEETLVMHAAEGNGP